MGFENSNFVFYPYVMPIKFIVDFCSALKRLITYELCRYRLVWFFAFFGGQGLPARKKPMLFQIDVGKGLF